MFSNVILNAVFLMLSLVTLADGYCFMSYAGPGLKDCVAPNEDHVEDGTRYTSYEECISCDCNNGFLNCCQMGITLVDLHPECKVVLDGPCWEKAVMKDNENEPCPYPHGGTGR
ncbi:Hypothetical predicted protein [Mytilus galloprovincialis]|uniref:Uncharacterized protein n=1 Tax=Mytilus galloprovincialis TaxID=29158 RepID=A0A8B6CZT4_MYTGA|nr:Hypothetical predicted protein [Mytilus galloprovincialis]